MHDVDAIEHLKDLVRSMLDVLECRATTGRIGDLLKAGPRDQADLQQFAGRETITPTSGMAEITTNPALTEVKVTKQLPTG